MAVNQEVYQRIRVELQSKGVTLVAVSKTKSVEDIRQLYDLGQRDFGENYVQELCDKAERLPKDIRWHFIGHLQSNKVKNIAPFVYLIHGVDRASLLPEIEKQAAKNDRVIDCLLQVHIAQEETKFGWSRQEMPAVLEELARTKTDHVRICGLMGMASLTENTNQVKQEFQQLRQLFDSCRVELADCHILSMGMSGDYSIALEEGTTLVRIGSLLFGARDYAS